MEQRECHSQGNKAVEMVGGERGDTVRKIRHEKYGYGA